MQKIVKTSWKELFDFLEEKVNFHYKKEQSKTPENISWICFGDLRFVEAFCKTRNLDTSAVIKRLNETGGYCDCEVLFNSVANIDSNEIMPVKPIKK